MLLHDVPRAAAASEPSAPSLVAGDRRWDAVGFAELVDALGSGLARHSVPGDRVAVVADNRPEFAALLYAAPRAGTLLAMGNTRHTTDELVDVLADAAPTVVVGTTEHVERLVERADDLGSVRSWWSLDDPPPGARHVDDLLAGPVVEPAPAHEDDPVWLIHTSGTTGRPKGVLLTHRSVLAAVANGAEARPMGPDDVYMFPFPLFHIAAYNVVHAHQQGRPVVLAARFDAADALATIERERVTQVSLAPTMVAMLLDHPDRAATDLSSLSRISYGASAMPPDLIRRTLAELPGVGLAQGYGMTELSGNAVFLGPEDHRQAVDDAPELLAAAGRPGPLVRVRIADEAGDELPTDTAGEILVSGPQVCAGYWNQPEETAAVLHTDPDGTAWIRTGDLGTVDDDGVLRIVDRLKDLVITGGENVSSREVEDVLAGHKLVRAVAVVGTPDERWGEAVCAAVVWTDGTDPDLAPTELRAWSEGRLAGFKRPRHVVTFDTLPTNASGKVDKRAVRSAVLAAVRAPRAPAAGAG
ncbi:MAG: long-chain fatty acid--CoA ligase [Actinobacteria bacterium]|nr:long-chain fatty acid--CoA ligase [Actinomycetota bacterium]